MQRTEERCSLSKFYTPKWVGQALISNLHLNSPRSILDLGCGEGALATAARLRWKHATIVTVDIDDRTHLQRRGLLRGDPRLHRHVVADALDPSLGKQARLQANSIDLAICNPPFQRPAWRPGFSHILEAAGLSHALRRVSDATSDLLFIAQNMRYLHRHGSMGLIVPDAIITGEKMKGIRKAIAPQIEKVIQLPRSAFSRTEAQTFILIIGWDTTKHKVELRELAPDGKYSAPLLISPEDGHSRLDYRFHACKQSTIKGRQAPLSKLGVEIVRGKLSSTQARLARFGTFHTSDFRLIRKGKIEFSGPALPKRTREQQTVAISGDILLARVDRKLEDKIAFVTKGEAALSDCVYRIRTPSSIRKRVLAGLKSQNGRNQIKALARGNGARHISIQSMLTIRV